MVVLPDTALINAEGIVESLRRRIEVEPAVFGVGANCVMASLGVAQFSEGELLDNWLVEPMWPATSQSLKAGTV